MLVGLVACLPAYTAKADLPAYTAKAGSVCLLRCKKWKGKAWFGRAGMDARAMLMTVYGKVLEYDDECEIKKPKALSFGSDNEDMISSNHFEKSGLLKVAPNPATDQISLSWSSLQETVQSLTIASMLGQKLMTLDDFKTVDHTVLDISHIKAGVYFIILQTDNGEKLSRKIIIHR